MSIVETTGLGRRYGSTWALRDADLTLPEGRLIALIGPNGAGKSTLLNMLVGLTEPTTGTITVLGGHPAGSPAALDGIAFVAQDMPLYRNLTVGDMIHLTRNLNVTFDASRARARLAELGISEKQKAGKLSGGQRAQLALSLALARHPRLLVLDEPTAPLDPLARHEFMATVMTAMAEDGISVVLSSHLLAELERVADHLVLVAAGRVRVDGPIGDLLDQHRLITSPTSTVRHLDGCEVIETTSTGAQTHRLVRRTELVAALPADAESRAVGIEELTLGYFRNDTPRPAPVLTGVSR
ncbi:MAG TPA: ABC transporter ATP-binding protein [Marmoricola sp.]|jgi:ABC-2 type transport system ATP-binding protein|nr:ABC transporter ATP-binding protein [Marmoricola sp.]